LKKQSEIVKLKMNVCISDGFVCFTKNEIHQILGLCEHVNDLTKQLQERSDFEAIHQEKISVRNFLFFLCREKLRRILDIRSYCRGYATLATKT
jgi:hypothetical protein